MCSLAEDGHPLHRRFLPARLGNRDDLCDVVGFVGGCGFEMFCFLLRDEGSGSRIADFMLLGFSCEGLRLKL